MSTQKHHIKAAHPDDIPVLARIAGAAFLSDRQTQMKSLGPKPYDHEKSTRDHLPDEFRGKRCRIIKVEDETSGDIMGYCSWVFRGFEQQDIPNLQGWQPLPDLPPQEEQPKEGPHPPPPATPSDPIQRLEALTGGDMQRFMDEIMPGDTKCLIVTCLIVAPQYQGRGVGSALLKWGTSICDETGHFAWVHSSQGASGAYRKAGFEMVQRLVVDLDEFAPCAPPGEGEGARWGTYEFQYMKYLPKS